VRPVPTIQPDIAARVPQAGQPIGGTKPGSVALHPIFNNAITTGVAIPNQEARFCSIGCPGRHEHT